MEADDKKMTAKDRVDYAKKYAVDIVKSVWIYVIIGVGLGAVIHGYAPSD